MPIGTRRSSTLFLAMAVFLLSCGETGENRPTAFDSETVEPNSPASLSKSPGGGKGGGDKGGGKTVQLSMSGHLNADPQTLSGTNDNRKIKAGGDLELTLALDLASLDCPEKPGSIEWEPGLVAFVQNNTPGVGTLSLEYDKTDPVLRSVDSWKTKIGGFSYQFQVFRWTSNDLTEQADGSSLVQYRGGSVEVFKKKGGRMISREQCFGNYVDYNLTAK